MLIVQIANRLALGLRKHARFFAQAISPAVCTMKGRDDCTTQGLCPGWAWFNGCDLQRCDDCAVFLSDDDALAHVRNCLSCQTTLGAEVAAFLEENETYGIAPLRVRTLD